MRTEDGGSSLLPVPPASSRGGECFHEIGGAWTQARGRYAGGVGLRTRAFLAAANADPAQRRVRLLDIGTGLGWNLAAAIDAVRGTGARLEAVSLERDVAPIRFASGWAGAGAGVPERMHRVVRRALRAQLAGQGLAPLTIEGDVVGTLRLVMGDARDTIRGLDGARFDAVFLDPFSPARADELWARPFLAEVASRMAPHGRLATYSAATAIRVELAATGLAVARGPRVGGKAEGTIAGFDLVPPPEDADLTRRLARRLGIDRAIL